VSAAWRRPRTVVASPQGVRDRGCGAAVGGGREGGGAGPQPQPRHRTVGRHAARPLLYAVAAGIGGPVNPDGGRPADAPGFVNP
jgi:hypothetical protein